MALVRRPDGEQVPDLPALRRVIPYLMRTRAEGTVYFPQRIEVEETLRWLDEVNARRTEAERIHLFEVFLAAIGRTLRLRPETNRFVAGRRTYQHRDITISFVVKSSLSDEGGETEARLTLNGDESVEEVHDLVQALVRRERAGAPDDDDRLVDFFASWPRPVLNGVSRLVSSLDYHNLLPRRLVSAIPLYTSVYVVNAGSIGVDAPYHHLYEHGTASVFVSIGRVQPEPVVAPDGSIVARRCVQVVHTLDERASDGFYFAKSAELFRRLVVEPSLLARSDLTVDEVVGTWPPRS